MSRVAPTPGPWMEYQQARADMLSFTRDSVNLTYIYPRRSRVAVMKRTEHEGPKGPVLRVVLADDHTVLRCALAALLEARSECSVVAEASDGREAVEAAERCRPDIVIMDVSMPGMNGVEATRQIHARFPSVKVVMLSAYGDTGAVGQALAAGAAGFIIKRSDIDELMLALHLSSPATPTTPASSRAIDVAELSSMLAGGATPPRIELHRPEREVHQRSS